MAFCFDSLFAQELLMIGFAWGVIIIHRHEGRRVVSGWGGLKSSTSP